MYSPTFEEFKQLAAKGNVVPVYRQLLADTLTPVSAFQKISDSDFAFLLESASGAEKVARYSILGSDPFMIFECRRDRVLIMENGKENSFSTADPLAELEKLVNRFKPIQTDGLPRYFGGAIGYLGYDCVRYVEHLPDSPPDTLDVPDLLFGFYDVTLVFDHLNHTIKIVCLARVDGKSEKDSYDEAIARIDRVVEKLRTPVTTLSDDITAGGDTTLEFSSNFEKEEFKNAVRACKEYILAGDAFQIVLSQRLAVETKAEPFNIYRTLRAVNPSPYMFYLDMKDLKLIGSSIEIMVRVEGDKVTLRPIAGTRRRGKTEEEDDALAKELQSDPKERAEHTMLLDLGRNDIGRVARYGTVNIDEQMIIEYYPYVMHMTSNVSGKLQEGKTAFDAFRASFPAGTLSGAPKVRAMEILDELEPSRRGPYGGAVGYIDFMGNMNTCITIRTIVLKDNVAYVQAGAGIVADSDPASEYEETLNKAKGLLRAIEVTEKAFDTG